MNKTLPLSTLIRMNEMNIDIKQGLALGGVPALESSLFEQDTGWSVPVGVRQVCTLSKAPISCALGQGLIV